MPPRHYFVISARIWQLQENLFLVPRRVFSAWWSCFRKCRLGTRPPGCCAAWDRSVPLPGWALMASQRRSRSGSGWLYVRAVKLLHIALYLFIIIRLMGGSWGNLVSILSATIRGWSLVALSVAILTNINRLSLSLIIVFTFIHVYYSNYINSLWFKYINSLLFILLLINAGLKLLLFCC